MKQSILSGMRPTGRLHLGNYWGALKNWVALQSKYRCSFAVADWHMLTTGYEDTRSLQDNIREMVLDWLAAGIDPERCTVFKQSDVPEHAELALLLSMITPLSWLENNPTWNEQLQELAKTKETLIREQFRRTLSPVETTFRDLLRDLRSYLNRTERSLIEEYTLFSGEDQANAQVSVAELLKWAANIREIDTQSSNRVATRSRIAHLENRYRVRALDSLTIREFEGLVDFFSGTADNALRTHGFLGYPVLQAADILLYHAELVPVGQDQLPHLELSREIARRFNALYARADKPVLTEPKPLLTETPKVPGIDARKMSKSYGNAVDLLETPESLKAKAMSMYTDPTKIRKDDKGHPEPCAENPPGCVVYAFHKLYSGHWQMRGQECREGRVGCVACKKDLVVSMEGPFGAFREARERLAGRKGLVEEILASGAAKAKPVAARTMEEVRRAMRLR